MRLLHNKPIQTKVTAVILLTCSAALLIAATALLGFQAWSFRQRFTSDLSSVVKIISKYAGGTIMLHDKASASELLEGLKAKTHIVGAGIVLTNGSVFASFEREGGNHALQTPTGKLGPAFVGKYLVYSEVLIDPSDNRENGWIYVRSNYKREFWALFKVYAGVVGLVLLISLMLALLLSARLQRVISLPILRLATTAKSVAENKDFSVRVQKLEEDEIGLFTEAFNQMLEQIQARDLELRESRQKIESLVNSIEGVVWEADPETLQFEFVSKQAERFLGFTAQEWVKEPNFWCDHLYSADRDEALRLTRDAVDNQRVYVIEYRMVAKDSSLVWVRSYGSVNIDKVGRNLIRGVLLDVTKEKAAAKELQRLHAELLQTSRLAGMAEVATGVLHNVGNVLNSVSVSATLVSDKLRQSKVNKLRRATMMLHQQNGHLAEFLTTNPKGKLLPDYLAAVAEQMAADETKLVAEMNSVTLHIEHLKQIVTMQQTYAKVSGSHENVSAEGLVEDALRLNSAAFEQHGIQVVREFDEQTPAVCVDRHKVLQILINLLRNARSAMDVRDRSERRLVMQVRRASSERVRITVRDNGAGIAEENLIKIFHHGFTTKKDGHGFGLHSGANAAKEMGGSLTAQSEGVGQGATFILELPVAPGVRGEESTSKPRPL